MEEIIKTSAKPVLLIKQPGNDILEVQNMFIKKPQFIILYSEDSIDIEDVVMQVKPGMALAINAERTQVSDTKSLMEKIVIYDFNGNQLTNIGNSEPAIEPPVNDVVDSDIDTEFIKSFNDIMNDTAASNSFAQCFDSTL